MEELSKTAEDSVVEHVETIVEKEVQGQDDENQRTSDRLQMPIGLLQEQGPRSFKRH